MKKTLLSNKIGGRPSIRPSLEKLDELYATHTAREIAEMYDVSITTVRSWIQRAREEIRDGERKVQ